LVLPYQVEIVILKSLFAINLVKETELDQMKLTTDNLTTELLGKLDVTLNILKIRKGEISNRTDFSRLLKAFEDKSENKVFNYFLIV
jgi:hypothetical protein